MAAFDRPSLPDWRDATAYRFDRLDRPGFAWEWLRRDSEYCDAVLAAGAGDAARDGAELGAERWGLVAFEDPVLPAPVARPLWLRRWDVAVLEADAVACDPRDHDAILLDGLGELATMRCASAAEHLLLTDGWRRVRIDVVSGSLRSGPVRLHWHLAGTCSAVPKIMALRRFLSVAASRGFPNRLWPREPRARRWTLALRAYDALAVGAGQRELAELLGSGEVGQTGWRTRDPSLRLQAQRLAAIARSLQGQRFAERFLASDNGG